MGRASPDEEIIRMIEEQVAGAPTSGLCRKHGLSPATFYRLKASYGGMDLSDAMRLKQPEDENAKLKRLPADAMLDNVVPKAPWESPDVAPLCAIGSSPMDDASAIGARASCSGARA